MAVRITATSPDGLYSADVYPVQTVMSAETNEASTMTLYFESDWAKYTDEDSSTNPLQLNSKIIETTGATITWRGYVESKALQEVEGIRYYTVYCRDPLGKLDTTAAMLSSTRSVAAADIRTMFCRETPLLALTEQSITLLANPVGSVTYAAYPTYNATESDAWVANSGCNRLYLHAAYTAGDATIKLCDASGSPDHGGFAPCGLLRINDNWLQYDGLIQDDNGYWWAQNVEGGVLGSTDANATNLYSAGTPDVVYNKIAKKIHPRQPVLVEARLTGSSPATWWPLDPQKYTVQVEEGRFDFMSHPGSFEGTGGSYDLFRATYGVFDEEDANAVTAGGVIEDLLKCPTSEGGPGLTTGEYSIGSALTDIKLARVYADRPMSTMEAIRQVLEETGLLRGSTDDALAIYYDHANGKIIAGAIQQAALGSPDETYTSYTQYDEDASLENIYSAVRVNYTDGQEYQLLDSEQREWHPAPTVARGSGSVAITYHLTYNYPGCAASDANTWKSWTTGTDRPIHGMLTDNRTDTGWGFGFTDPDDPGTGVYACYLWFPIVNGAVMKAKVNRVVVCLDLSKKSETTHPIRFHVVGFQTVDATPSVEADFDDEVMLSSSLAAHFRPLLSYTSPAEDGDNTAKYTEYTLDVKDIGVECQAIGLVFDGLPRDVALVGSLGRCVKIREIAAFGDALHSVFVHLTDQSHDDDGTQRGDELYAPESYAKLVNVDARLDAHRVLDLDVGPSSYAAALTLGRLALQSSLVLTQVRNIEVDYSGAAIPTLCDTARFLSPSGYYQGVILSMTRTRRDGGCVQNFRVLNYNSELI